MVKLDIKRAYDEVDRENLLKVLEKFGFDLKWINWVKSFISTLHFLVILNEILQGIFET